MFVMNLEGGFANQLFRYACGYQISKKYNQEMVLLIYDKKSYVDAFLLDELSIPCHRRIYVRVSHNPEYVRELLGLDKILYIDETNFDCLNEMSFDADTLVYVDAAFQKPIYFEQYINEIRDVFQMRNISKEMAFFKEKIKDRTSVAVHVRRRDFVEIRNAYGNQDINSFYKAAVAYFRKTVKDPVFYVISDDISFCFDYFGNKRDIHFVKIPGGKDADIEEFFCMSWCTHRVLTRGSSFGRMADLLNPEENKITVYMGEEKNKDHIVYLGQEKIKELSEEYDDAERTEKERAYTVKIPDIYFDATKDYEKNILPIYLDNIKRKYDAGQFEYAEQTLIKAWQYGYGSEQFHRYYYMTLKELKKEKEAIIEAVAYLRANGEPEQIKKDFSAGDISKIKRFFEQGAQKFFIIPYESYMGSELNQLCNLGILLQRMGNEVSYVFRKAGERLNGTVHNEILTSNYMFTNCRGYKYKSRMYCLDIIRKQYPLDEFISEAAGSDGCCVITDASDVLKEIRHGNFEKVYWKAVNTYRDDGRDSEPDEADVLQVDKIIIDETVDGKSDGYITIDRMPLITMTDRRDTISEQYAYDNGLFEVIEQLALGWGA